MIGWRKVCTLQDYLVRAKITNKDTNESKTGKCNRKRYQVSQYFEETCESEDAICKGVVNCNTGFAAYIFHSSSCYNQYVESNITDFCYQLSNYKSAFRKVL